MLYFKIFYNSLEFYIYRSLTYGLGLAKIILIFQKETRIFE